MFLINKKLSISKKLTLIYSSILLGILIIFTLFTFLLIRSFMVKNSQEVLSSNADILSSYMENMNSIDSKSVSNINLSQGIYYSVYDENENIIFSNLKTDGQSKLHHQDRRFRKNDVFEQGDGIISTSRSLNVNGKSYRIVVAKNFEDIGNKAGDIVEILITVSILGIIVSFISGSFLIKKLLRPIKDITSTAKEITSKSLSMRIPIKGAKDEISDLADTFNLMIERLEVDFEKQRRFVSDASHELRTPLAVMHGHVNMLNRWGKNDPEQLNKSLKTLKAETENMNRLVESLLYLAKGDNEVLSIKKEEFQLYLLLKEIVDETRISHNKIEITYSCADELNIYADYNNLKQVLRVLIDNSLKFSKDPAQIMISGEDRGEEVLIKVIDNGMGIPEESLSKIFDRFYRVDESRTKATGGTGLGLSIAKQIVEYHRGKIFAESKLGQWTQVNILLPKLI